MFLLSSYYVVIIIILIMMIQGQGQGQLLLQNDAAHLAFLRAAEPFLIDPQQAHPFVVALREHQCKARLPTGNKFAVG